MPTIALVDDDRNILTSVSLALEAEGFIVQTYTDGVTALDGLTKKAAPADLAVFDIKMPRMDGLELLRRLREKSKIPVIFLTSKDDEIDELFGLKMGADDFITKPFSLRLLVERIKTVLRRDTRGPGGAGGAGGAPKGASARARGAGGDAAQDGSAQGGASRRETDEQANLLERGFLRLDKDRHICEWKGEKLVLTVTEFKILLALAQRPGIVKSRDQLMDEAYDDQVYVDDRTVDSHIKRLRKKFRSMDGAFDRIETLYGMGYRFKEEEGRG